MANGISSMESSNTVKVGDKVMTLKEFKEWVKQKQNERLEAQGKKPKEEKKRKKKAEVKEISAVAMEIEKMVKPITTLKSFSAYYDHAYRQWGTIANEILQHRKIRPHFVHYRVCVSELESLISATESGFLEAYKKHECINGKGRRLGLQTLMNKSFKAISQLEDTIGTLKKIADDGTDPFAVGTHMSAKTRARCWA